MLSPNFFLSLLANLTSAIVASFSNLNLALCSLNLNKISLLIASKTSLYSSFKAISSKTK
ncbi:hypothetical protein [Campylobacter geochelonis]|uniref:hypothetical protein n=1 Tax=Campylobacter geochelonis TaxID=1780362 RepID=UPI001F61FEE5|nr:hypothetical protein [Campylobacter geochelonis]